jgi:hypothetical protein
LSATYNLLNTCGTDTHGKSILLRLWTLWLFADTEFCCVSHHADTRDYPY